MVEDKPEDIEEIRQLQQEQFKPIEVEPQMRKTMDFKDSQLEIEPTPKPGSDSAHRKHEEPKPSSSDN